LSLERGEIPHDERSQHDREERQQETPDAVMRIDEDLQRDHRRQERQRDELEESHLQETLARNQVAELQIAEDEERVDEIEDEKDARRLGGQGDRPLTRRPDGLEEDGRDAVRERQLRQVEEARERQSAAAQQLDGEIRDRTDRHGRSRGLEDQNRRHEGRRL